MESILTQFRKRQVFKVATIYAVSAWPLIQIADLAVPALGLPDSVMALLLKIFIIGFPVCLIFAWLVNFTSEGMVRAGQEHREQHPLMANFRTTVVIAGALIVALVVTIGSQMFIDPQDNDAATQLTEREGRSEAANQAPGSISKKGKSIAVLPFVAFSKVAEDEFFVDGMVEELLNLLANIPDLRVAARTSSFSYKGVSDKTIIEIGKELGVDTILEGSFRKNDTTNKIRITAQLIDVNTGDHLWSETFDREYLDIFKIQDEIANSVVDKMKVTLLGSAARHEFVVGTHDVDAMVEYGKGQKELAHRTVASIKMALGHFKAAVSKDSDYARAHVGVADAHTLLAMYGGLDAGEAKQAANAAIDKALSLDSELGNAYASRGLVLMTQDPKQAEIAFKRAMELNPNYGMAYMWYGSLLKERGDLSGARKMFEKALELDPKSPIAANNVAWGYYAEGLEDKSMELFSQIIANDPYYPGAYNLAGAILMKRGHLDGAMEMYERALRVDSVNKEAAQGLIMTSMDLGDIETADYWFNYVKERPGILDNSEFIYLQARYLASQGQLEKALLYLDQVKFSPEEIRMNQITDAEKAFYKKDYREAARAYENLQATDLAKQGYFFHINEGLAAAHLVFSYQQIGETEKADQLIQDYLQYLEGGVGKKANHPNYYYSMALLKSLQHKPDESIQYLQGAIDAGWVTIWRTAVEPIFEPIVKQEQFLLMMGGVNAKLTNMRTRLQDKSSFLAG